MATETPGRLYEKLAKDIVYSSVWGCDSDVCKVWVTMIALKGRDHVVTASVTGIARITTLTVEAVERCLEILQQPDPQSQSKSHEGRRLLKVDTGFLVVNGGKYREMGWSEEKREWERSRKQKQREKRDSEGGEPPATKCVEKDHTAAQSILQKMRDLSGVKFRGTDSDIAAIEHRLVEPDITTDGIITMLERMWKKWATASSGDGKPMRDYFRVSTLFKREKFNDYYAQKDQPTEAPKTNPNQPRQSELKMSIHAVKPNGW